MFTPPPPRRGIPGEGCEGPGRRLVECLRTRNGDDDVPQVLPDFTIGLGVKVGEVGRQMLHPQTCCGFLAVRATQRDSSSERRCNFEFTRPVQSRRTPNPVLCALRHRKWIIPVRAF